MSSIPATTGNLEPKTRGYDTETIERALWTLALQAGSGKQASESLAAQGITRPDGQPIDRQTICEWRDKDPARYERIQTEASDTIAQKIAADAEAFMVNAARVEALALEKLEEQIHAGQVKDIGSALRNLSTSKALNNDKIASPLRGRPSRIVEDRTPDKALTRLKTLHPGLFVEGTAEELSPPRELESAASA